MKTSREQLSTGEIRFSTDRCTFLYSRLRPNVLYIIVAGYDKGELRSLVFDEIQKDTKQQDSVQVFIDARQVKGIDSGASDLWTEWIRSNRILQGVHVLVESKVIHMILAISKELTRRGNVMQVYSSPEAFKKAIHEVVPDVKEWGWHR